MMLFRVQSYWTRGEKHVMALATLDAEDDWQELIIFLTLFHFIYAIYNITSIIVSCYFSLRLFHFPYPYGDRSSVFFM